MQKLLRTAALPGQSVDDRTQHIGACKVRNRPGNDTEKDENQPSLIFRKISHQTRNRLFGILWLFDFYFSTARTRSWTSRPSRTAGSFRPLCAALAVFGNQSFLSLLVHYAITSFFIWES